MHHKTQSEVVAAIDDYVHKILDNPQDDDDLQDSDIPSAELTRQCVDFYWLKSHWRAKNDPDFPYVFDAEAATDVVRFAEVQVITEGVPMRLQLMPSHLFILTMLYGWRHRETGLRRFRRAYIAMARKSAKSVLASIIGLYELQRSDDHGGQVFVASARAATAMIVYAKARDLIKQNELMADTFGFEIISDAIKHEPSNSVLSYLSGDNRADSSKFDGLSCSAYVIDETHLIPSNAGLISSLSLSTQSRRNSLGIEITTAGFKPDSRAHETHEITKRIVSGSLDDPNLFCLYYGLDNADLGRDDLFSNPYIWRKCSPGWGISIIPEAFAANAREAEMQPSKRSNWMIKVANVFGSGMGAFAQPAKLEKVRAHDNGIAWLELSKREVILGIDSASSNDLYGIGIFALETETEAPYVTTLAIAPPLTVQTVPYISNAVDNGEITTTHQSKEMLDIERVEEYLYSVIERLNVVAIYYDPHGLKTTASKLLNRYPKISVNYVTQGYVQLSPAIQYLQEQIEASQGLDKRIGIDLKGVQERFWHNLNVEYNKEGLMKPIKTKSDNFIDPPASLITAVAGHLNYIWVKANKRPKRDLSSVSDLPIISW